MHDEILGSTSVFVKKAALWIVCSILAACASRVPPNGGQVDKTPPEISSTEPANFSRNMQSDRITLNFNEFIELKDGGSGIFISPPLRVTPEYLLKGKSLQIRFKEKPDSNTTYTMVLGKSVTDLTEGNKLVDFPYVFATGDALDTLQISGTVKDAFTRAALKETVVAMYTSTNDSIPQFELPRYFARCDEAGNYTLRNIKTGQYRILAFTDQNNDLKITLPEEKLAFTSETITIDSAQTNLPEFRLFNEQNGKLKLLRKAYELPGKVKIKYSLSLDSFRVEQLKPGESISLQYNFKSGQDSIGVWVPGEASDSLVLLVRAKSKEQSRTDTLLFSPKRMAKMGGSRGRSKASVDTALVVKVEPSLKIRQRDSLRLRFSAPVERFDTSRAISIFGSDSLPYRGLIWSADKMSAYLNGLANGKSGNIRLLKGAFTDIFGRKNDSLNLAISYYLPEDLGKLIFNISALPDGECVFELVDKSGNVTERRRIKESQALIFEGLLPGQYSARLIEDTDANGLWTNGDWKLRRQPEHIHYFGKELNMRADWDLEQEWKVVGISRK